MTTSPGLAPVGLLVRAEVIELDDGSKLFSGYAGLFIDQNGQVYALLGDYHTLGLDKHDP